jgi:hypothetical protein
MNWGVLEMSQHANTGRSCFNLFMYVLFCMDALQLTCAYVVPIYIRNIQTLDDSQCNACSIALAAHP